MASAILGSELLWGNVFVLPKERVSPRILSSRKESPLAIRATLCTSRGMKLNKEFRFFAYLLESYAAHKNMSASEVLRMLDEKNLTDFVFGMYEIYHCESIDNAFMDLDSLIETGKPAW